MSTGRAHDARPAMVDVELEVEDEGAAVLAELAAASPHAGRDDDAGAADPAPRAADPRGGRRRVRLRLAALGAVALALAGAGVASLVESRRAQVRAAELAALPGVVGSLADPVEPVWHASTALGSTTAGGLLLRWQERVGGLELQAIDVVSGAERWTAPRGPDGVDWCEGEAGTAAQPVVVCWRVSPVRAVGADGTEETFEGALLAVSVADGTVVATHPVALPSSGYGVLEGDVVLGYRDGGTVRVERRDPVTGAQVWRRDVRLTARQVDGSVSAWLTVEEDLVVVHGATTAVLTAEGEVLGTWDAVDLDATGVGEAQQGADVAATRAGFGVWPQAPADGAATGTWYDRDGGELAPVEGFLAEPEVTDGSAGHVLLTAARTRFDLAATDVRTGERLWTVPLGGGAVLLRRDGAAVVADGRRVFAVDVVTGAERWSVPVPGVRPDLGSVTDGEHVVVMARQDGRWVLEAVGFDGVPGWTVAVPEQVSLPEVVPPGTEALRGIEGRVVTTDGQALVGLG